MRDKFKALPARIGWLVILSSALWVSGWSLYYIARHWGVPNQVAIFFSACYDGVALLSADYALRAVRDGASDRWPRTLVIVFALCSAYLNSLHAVIGHETSAARLAWAAPPVAAVIAYDLHTRSERRKAKIRYGAIYARPMPGFGPLTWALFPLSTFNVLRTIVERRRLALENTANDADTPKTKTVISGKAEPAISAQPKRISAAPNVISISDRPSPRVVRAWAKQNGYQVGDRARISQQIWDAYAEASGD